VLESTNESRHITIPEPLLSPGAPTGPKVLAIVGSPHAEQVMIDQRLGFESNPGEKTSDFSIAL